MNLLSKETFSKDLFASFVVFLISMPLCLAVAVACGVDPIKGIFTGIIGGVIVGILSGSPLQISGPSPGLAVMALYAVSTYGPDVLIPLGLVVGVFQISIAVLRVAHFFQATPPALLKGMLSGIGALIVTAQVYILFGEKMTPNGLTNLIGIPGLFVQLSTGAMSQTQIYSAIVGVIAISVLIAWSFGKTPFFELFPAPLASILFGSMAVWALGWDVSMITIPDNIFAAAFDLNHMAALKSVDSGFFLFALGFAFVATVETLLCVSAVDKMAKSTSSYNRQILALGIGNSIVGFVGAIPVVGVIVRSAANIEFGAKTKLSSILAGTWLGLFLLLPGVLSLIPISALAGLLIYTGIKLLDVKHMFDYIKSPSKSSLIFFTTFLTTLSIGLLQGVVAGFMVSVAILVYDVLKFDLDIEERGENKVLKFKGKLSFLDLPVLSKELQKQNLEGATNLEICLQEVEYLDPAILEHLDELKNKLEAKGTNTKIKYSKLNVH